VTLYWALTAIAGYRIRFAASARARYGPAVRLGRSIGVLALACVAFLLVSGPASAVDSDLKYAYAFKVEASNGYSIVAYAGNERADGRGQIVLFVLRGDEGAIYAAPALLTKTSLTADLGALGKVDLDVSPSGRTKRFRSTCREEPESFTYEPPRYTGSFEFRGEEGYADAVSAAPSEFNRFFYEVGCVSTGGGESGGANTPGARLRLYERRGDFRLMLQANKNGPRKRSRLEVEVHEKRGKVRIFRSTSVWLGTEAFRFDPALETATLDPPAPFSGRASFHRGAAPANRWSGDLAVDLPGRSDVPLTGTGVRATLIHSCWGEGGSPSC
jgi:hypothetical protein